MTTLVTVTPTIAAMVVLVGAASGFHAARARTWRHKARDDDAHEAVDEDPGPGSMGPGMHGGAMKATQVSEDQAKAIVEKHVDEQLKGFTIERAIPSTSLCRSGRDARSPAGLPRTPGARWQAGRLRLDA